MPNKIVEVMRGPAGHEHLLMIWFPDEKAEPSCYIRGQFEKGRVIYFHISPSYLPEEMKQKYVALSGESREELRIDDVGVKSIRDNDRL